MLARLRALPGLTGKGVRLAWRSRLPILVVVGIVVLLLALWKLPEWQVPDAGLSSKERFDIENSARLTIAQIVGGIALLGTLYFTWRRVGAAEKTVALTEQGQITERFTRAITQLGDSELSIRLGGIYALERIARDSERDHWPIMEVLTAYVRENARWDDANPPPPRDRPPADIQAILTVLGRRERSEKREGDRRLDLARTDLGRADLVEAHLERAYLFGARLEGADLSGAHLEGAHLRGAHLEGANLIEAHLEGADLVGARRLGAFLHDAIGLTQAQLDVAHTDDATRLPDGLEHPHRRHVPDEANPEG